MAANLKAILSFDGRAYEAGMKKAESLSKKTSSNIASSFKGALLGIVSVGYIAQQTKQVAEFAKQLSQLAPTLGMTTDELQKYEYIFARQGLEIDDVADAFATLADRTEDALAGTESMIEDFRLVGITVDQLRGKNPEQLFMLFADAVSKTEDKNRALTSIVRNLGDDLGRKLAPALMQGSEKMREMKKEAEDLGMVIEEAQIDKLADAVVDMEIASKRLERIWGGIANFGVDLFNSIYDGIKLLNPFSQLFGGLGSFVGTLESGGSFKDAIKAFDYGAKVAGREYEQTLIDRELAIMKRQEERSNPIRIRRNQAGINDEKETKEALLALQKKMFDSQFKEMSKEQQLNVLYQQRLAIFQKIRSAKNQKERYELMGQDFDLFQQMRGLYGQETGGAGSARTMTQTASQGVGAFAKRANPLIQVGRQQLDVARQTLEVQRAMLARQQSTGRIF